MENKCIRLIIEDLQTHPHCSHGPTLLFERFTKRKCKRFYACSATRDRKLCNFYMEYDDINKRKQKQNHFQNDKFNYSENKLLEFCQLPQLQRKFCHTCSLILLPNQWSQHKQHHVMENVSLKNMKEPSTLLASNINNKDEAQYLFTVKCSEFIVKSLKKLNFNRVICIGTPRIHEYIIKEDTKLQMKSILLDIDSRYKQFYSNHTFLYYNLFNNYFFDRENSKETLENFISKSKPNQLVLLIDPPFGGLIEAFSHTLKKISLLWKTDELIPLILFFPYFNENRIIESLPSLLMLDYMVEYENHKSFKNSSSGRKYGSPIRMFTNIKSIFVLPESQGYHFCHLCERYVHANNKHCLICNSCTSKDGKPYKHCDRCQKCVKITWNHCDSSNRCLLSDGITQRPEKKQKLDNY